MQLELIAHNIRSAQNIGSLLRTSDALGVKKIWLTGYSAGIGHKGVIKTALGAEKMVDSEERVEVTTLIKELKEKGFWIVGLEIDGRASELGTYRTKRDKVALLLGNEVEGVAPYLMDLCDELIYIKQHGGKESLNVSVATAIAVWALKNSC